MPDFDQNAQPILKDQSLNFPEEVFVKAPKQVDPMDPGRSILPAPTLSQGEEDAYDKLNRLSAQSTGRGKGIFVSNAELDANRRYNAYNPTLDNIEDFYAQRQGFFEKGKNGILKGANLAATTIAGGFGMVGGLAQSAFTGRMADIWDNDFMRALDKWNEKVDNEYLPNYYTQKEKDAEWYSPSNWWTGNFLFDKLIKNSGFAVGAMLSGNIASAAIGGIGAALGTGAAALAGAAEASQAFRLFTPILRNTARAFSAGKNIEAAAALEKGIRSIAHGEALASELANMARTTSAFGKFSDSARRTAIAAYSSAGEASFEALQTGKEHRNSLIEEYKATHSGNEPQGEDLKIINEEADNVGKFSFMGNLALLGATEFVQLPKLMGSTYAAEKQAANSLRGVADDVVLKGGKYVAAAKPPVTRFGKLYQGVAKAGKYVYDPKEMGQEFAQFGLQVGTQNYFRKEKESGDGDIWTDGFLYGMFGHDKEGRGVGALTSKEGIEGGLMGGLTGGLMQAKATYQERGARKTNTDQFINMLDHAPTFRDAFKDKLGSVNRAVVLHQQQQEATVQGEELEARDLRFDSMHNYMAPRVKYGRFDMVMEDMKELREGGMTDKGLAELKAQGMAGINDTVASFQKRVNTMEQYAKDTNDLYHATNLRYAGETLKDADGEEIRNAKGETTRKYSPLVIDKMVYAASKIANYDVRIPQLNAELTNAGLQTYDVLQSIIENNRPNLEATEKALQDINALNVISDKKDKLKTQLSDMIELSLRRQSFLQEYDAIKDKPLNYEQVSPYPWGAGEREEMDVTVTQRVVPEGKTYRKATEVPLEVGTQYSLSAPIRNDNGDLTLAPKMTVLSQTLGGEFEVRMPNGKVKFLTPSEFKEYALTEEDNAFEGNEEMLHDAFKKILDKPRFAAAKAAMEKAGFKDLVSKLNSLRASGDVALANAVEAEFNRMAEAFLREKRERAAKEELYRRNKEQWADAQTIIEGQSATVPGVPTKDVTNPKEPPLKDAEHIFLDTTTEKEESHSAHLAHPHIRRAREFLNKVDRHKNRGNMRAVIVHAGNAASYGLQGIVQKSYGKSEDTPLSELKNYDGSDATDVNMGFLAQVYMVQEGGKNYFVDKEGNKISDKPISKDNKVDLDKVIFQTMSNTDINYQSGDPKYRQEQKDLALYQQKAYKLYREGLWKAGNVQTPMYKFGISRGFPVENPGAREFNHVGGVLLDEHKIETQQELIQIPTTGTISHGTRTLSFPNGVPILKYGATITFLNNRLVNDDEALALYKAIEKVADTVSKQMEKGEAIRPESPELTFVRNMLYWAKKAVNTDNQIRIDENTMNLVIGGLSVPLTEVASKQAEIIEQLKKAYVTVNNKALKAEFSTPFREFYVDGQGVLQSRNWTNYQTFLLAANYPNGDPRPTTSTPLTTSVAKPTTEIPYAFMQRYSTLQTLEFPVVPGETKPEPKGAPAGKKAPADGETIIVDGYTVDGKTPNTFKTNKDDTVTFTARVEEGKVLVDVTGGPALARMATTDLQASKDLLTSVGIPITEVDPNDPTKTVPVDPNKIALSAANRYISARLSYLVSRNEFQRPGEAPPGGPPTGGETTILKVGDHTIDGKTDNAWKLPSGPVATFTAQLEDGKIVAKVTGGAEAIDALANGAGYEATIVPEVKLLGAFDASVEADGKTPTTNAKINNVKKYMNMFISASLTKQYEEQLKNAPTQKGDKQIDAYLSNIDAATSVITLSINVNNIDHAVKEGAILSPEQATKLAAAKERIKAEGYEMVPKHVHYPGDKVTVDTAAAYDGRALNEEQKRAIKSHIESRESRGEEVIVDGLPAIVSRVLVPQLNNAQGVMEQTPKINTLKFSSVDEARKAAGMPAKVPTNKSFGIGAITVPHDFNTTEFTDIANNVAGEEKVNVNMIKRRYFHITMEEAETYMEVLEHLNIIGAPDAGGISVVLNKDKADIKDLIDKKVKKAAPPSGGGPSGGGTFGANGTTGGTFGDDDGSDVPFRVVGFDGKERMTKYDMEVFKEWAAKNVPLIPWEVLENLIAMHGGKKAWGVFENGVAKFVRGGLRGTEYHEIGEAIWNGILSPDEQQALLDEFKDKSGKFTDRETGKKIDYSKATDNQAKERILDDFSDFRLGKLPARTLGEKIARFFKRIMDWFKSFVMKPTLKDQLFEAIDTGKFKDIKLREDVKSMAPEYRAVEDMSEEETAMYVDDMIARATGLLFTSADGKKFLYSPRQIVDEALFAKVEQQFKDHKEIRQDGSVGDSKRDYISDKAWEQLKVKVKDALKARNIELIEEDINTEGANKNDYVKEAFAVTGKENSSRAVKIDNSTMIERREGNQENQSAFKLPVPKFTNKEKQTLKLMNFNQTFNTKLAKFANTSGIQKYIDKVVDLANNDANYVTYFQRIGGQVGPGAENKEIPFSQFDFVDWRFFIDTWQTFTKQKPDALIQYKALDEIYTGAANLFDAVKSEQAKWIENMRTIARTKTGLIGFNIESKTYNIDQAKLTAMEVDENGNPTKQRVYHLKGPVNQIKFLQDIGIEFPMSVYRKLRPEEEKGGKSSQQEQFSKAVSVLYDKIGEKKQLMSLSGKLLNVGSPLNIIAELYVNASNPNQDPTFFGVGGQRLGTYTENNNPSVFENEFNEAETLTELLTARPELRDIFSENSQVLKLGGLYFDKNGDRTTRKIKVKYIQGTKDTNFNEGTATAALGLGDRTVQEMNQNLHGNYYVLIPADGVTEWMMNLGNSVDFTLFDETGNNAAWEKINQIFEGYLYDDIKLARDHVNRSRTKNVRDKGATQLRFFHDILTGERYEKVRDELYKMITSDTATFDDIKAFVKTKGDTINSAVSDYIHGTMARTEKLLEDNNQLLVNDVTKTDELSYKFPSLDTKFAGEHKINTRKMSETVKNNVLLFSNVNYIINNIEYHKILFGDPFQFAEKKGKLDLIKRVKSFLSPRRTTFDMPEFNTFLNENMNDAGKFRLRKRNPDDPNDIGDIGHHEFKPFIKTTVLQDHMIYGSTAALIAAYGNTDESDGFSWVMDNTYREAKIKNKQWGDKAEAFHQWQMAYTRLALAKKGFYKGYSRGLREHDEALTKRECPTHVLEIMKPIVTGSKHGMSEIELVLHKTAQMPIYYSMVEGKAMEDHYLNMLKQDMGYAIVASGAKMGIEVEHPNYTKDGKINQEPYNNIVNVPWKAFGIQVETATEKRKLEGPRGSQLTKMASMNLFANGQVIGATPERQREIHEMYKKNTKILDQMHQNAYNELLNSLSIVDMGDHFVMTDGRTVSETLMKELMKRVVSDNLKDTLEIDDETNMFRIPFEASPSYVQIRSVMYSMIDKAILSPKMHGGAHVQVPVTMFEEAIKGRSLVEKVKNPDGSFTYEKRTREEYEALSDDQKKNVFLTDDTLKFYENEDGKRYCEIMVPHWFKDSFPKVRGETDKQHEARIMKFLNDKNNPHREKILRGIGFRIPTQSLSSVEVFKVAGFLPQYMGNTVVVPSEITTKAGSDFDIDKLNMYLKSVYIDADGIMHMVELKGSERETKAFYANVHDRVTAVKIRKMTKAADFREKLISIFEKMDSVDDADFLWAVFDRDLLTKEERDFFTDNEDIISDMFDQAEANGMMPSEYLADQHHTEATKKYKLTEASLIAKSKDAFVKDMYKKALENEYYESLEELITLPEVFDQLIKPVDDAGLSKVAERLDELRGEDENLIKNRTLDRAFMTGQRHAFVIAKKWVGVAAQNITSLSLKQKTIVHFDINKLERVDEKDAEFLGDGSIQLDHNFVMQGQDKVVSLSGIDVATPAEPGQPQERISDRYSGYATSFVDVAKDPFILKIIQSDLAINTFMFLENAGVGKQAAFFMAQPIISEYLKMLDGIGSSSLYSVTNIAAIYGKFGISEELRGLNDGKINPADFEKNIETYYKRLPGVGTPEFKAEQANIFVEFLKYAKMADFSFEHAQATSYDTTRVNNGDHFARKQWQTEQVKQNNIFTGVDDIMSSTFLGKQEELLNLTMSAYGAIFKLEDRRLRMITETVLKPYGLNKYMSSDEFNKVANKIKSSFLDYIIQTKTKFYEDIHELVVDNDTSIAKQLETLKQKYPESYILRELEAVSGERPGSAKSIKLSVNVTDAYDENRFTGMMRELRDSEDPEVRTFFKNLVKVSIIQGTSPSAINIRNIIPIEDYSAIVAPIMQQLVDDESVKVFAEGFFQKNQFKDDAIVPKVNPGFKPDGVWRDGEFIPTNPVGVDQYGVMLYDHKTMAFPDFTTRGIKSSDRKILILNERYNAKDMGHDFIKIPRIIGDMYTGRIDFVTGRTVTDAHFSERKKVGDYTLNDMFGYQKVKDAMGNPLTGWNQKTGTFYVYKLVNLLGDGNRAVEHYPDMRPSVIDNASAKMVVEMTNEEIFEIFNETYTPVAAKERLPLDQIELIEDSKEYTKAMMEHMGARPTSSGILKVDGQFYYLDTKNWKAEQTTDGYDLYVYPDGKTDPNNERYYLASSYTGSKFYFSDEAEGREHAKQMTKTEKFVPILPLSKAQRFTRASAALDKSHLYLFTDNAGRSSGSGVVDENSPYFKKYGTPGQTLHYPTMTQAVARGLSNAFPITTMVNDQRQQWTDDRFDEYKKIIDDEIATIKAAAQNYKGIKFSGEAPFGAGAISNMAVTAPKIHAYLNEKLKEISIDNTGPVPVYYKGPPTAPTVTTPVTQTPSKGVQGVQVKPGIHVNQGALNRGEQMELFNYLKPFLESQAAKTNKGANANKMMGLGLRWDYKSNNPGREAVNIPDTIDPSHDTKYGYYTEAINGQPLAPITPRFRELIQKATGVDMTNYDGAIINLYDNTTFISAHNDVNESKSAIKYPVIGVNIGGTGNFSIESPKDPKQLSLMPGTAYVFGVGGVNREVFHRTFPQAQKSFLPEITTGEDGKTYPEGSYRITITMRRVMPLTAGMAIDPTLPVTRAVPNVDPNLEPNFNPEGQPNYYTDLERNPNEYQPTLEDEIAGLEREVKELEDTDKVRKDSQPEYKVANALGDIKTKITTASAQHETGGKVSTRGNKKDINANLIDDKTGQTVKDVANRLWRSLFNMDDNITDQDVRNIIIDVLREGKEAYMEGLDSDQLYNKKQELAEKKYELKQRNEAANVIKINRLERRHVAPISVRMDKKTVIIVNTDGTMHDQNNIEVTDKTMKNKVNIRIQTQEGSIRVSTLNSKDYFVLLDDTITETGKTTTGREPELNERQREVILAKAVLQKNNC